MNLIGEIKSKIIYWSWKMRNPRKPFAAYYVHGVERKIRQRKPHLTCGNKLKDIKRFEATAALEFELLKKLGLSPGHHFCDYGCGSLRMGELLVDYLNRGCYHGLDITDAFYKAGIERIGHDKLESKKATLAKISEKSTDRLKNKMHFVFSSAVMFHIPLGELNDFFHNIIALMAPGGIAVVDFTRSDKIEKIGAMTWRYPETVIAGLLKQWNVRFEFRSVESMMASGFYDDNHCYVIFRKSDYTTEPERNSSDH